MKKYIIICKGDRSSYQWGRERYTKKQALIIVNKINTEHNPYFHAWIEKANS